MLLISLWPKENFCFAGRRQTFLFINGGFSMGTPNQSAQENMWFWYGAAVIAHSLEPTTCRGRFSRVSGQVCHASRQRLGHWNPSRSAARPVYVKSNRRCRGNHLPFDEPERVAQSADGIALGRSVECSSLPPHLRQRTYHKPEIP